MRRPSLLMAITLLSVSCDRQHAVNDATQDQDRQLAVNYDQYRRPDALVAALAIAPGARVADVGAGRGYLTGRLAAAAGAAGRVVAVDVDENALNILRARPVTEGAAPVEARVVAPDDPALEPGAYDRILLAEVDHLLPDRAAYFSRLRGALAPRGQIAVANRRVYRAPLLDAAARAGLSVARESDALPGQFLVLLEVKP